MNYLENDFPDMLREFEAEEAKKELQNENDKNESMEVEAEK